MMNLPPDANMNLEQPQMPPVYKYPSMTLTVSQMAKILNISRNTAYELVKQPGFPCFHLGKRILINRDMLQSWLNDQCCQTA